MKIKNKDIVNAKLTWQEVQKDGKISDRTYRCNAKHAEWHMIQMRTSPTLRNVKMEKI